MERKTSRLIPPKGSTSTLHPKSPIITRNGNTAEIKRPLPLMQTHSLKTNFLSSPASTMASPHRLLLPLSPNSEAGKYLLRKPARRLHPLNCLSWSGGWKCICFRLCVSLSIFIPGGEGRERERYQVSKSSRAGDGGGDTLPSHGPCSVWCTQGSTALPPPLGGGQMGASFGGAPGQGFPQLAQGPHSPVCNLSR